MIVYGSLKAIADLFPCDTWDIVWLQGWVVFCREQVLYSVKDHGTERAGYPYYSVDKSCHLVSLRFGPGAHASATHSISVVESGALRPPTAGIFFAFYGNHGLWTDRGFLRNCCLDVEVEPTRGWSRCPHCGFRADKVIRLPS